MKRLSIFTAVVVSGLGLLWLSETLAARQSARRIPDALGAFVPHQAEDPPKKKKEDEPEEGSPAAIIKQAHERLITHSTMQAEMTELVEISGRRFLAKGRYRRKNLKLRLEFQTKVGTQEGSLLEVCDGSLLWTQHRIGDESWITRRDVDQILAKATSTGVGENLIKAEIGLGGLPALLASLEQAMTFDTVTEETIDEEPVYVVEGEWSEEFRERLTGNAEPYKAEQGARFPAFIPERVRITLHRETLQPRKLEYLKIQLPRTFFRPMVTLTFRNMIVDEPISDTEFEFEAPDGVIPQDETEEFLRLLEPQEPAPTTPSGFPTK